MWYLGKVDGFRVLKFRFVTVPDVVCGSDVLIPAGNVSASVFPK